MSDQKAGSLYQMLAVDAWFSCKMQMLELSISLYCD